MAISKHHSTIMQDSFHPEDVLFFGRTVISEQEPQFEIILDRFQERISRVDLSSHYLICQSNGFDMAVIDLNDLSTVQFTTPPKRIRYQMNNHSVAILGDELYIVLTDDRQLPLPNCYKCKLAELNNPKWTFIDLDEQYVVEMKSSENMCYMICYAVQVQTSEKYYLRVIELNSDLVHSVELENFDKFGLLISILSDGSLAMVYSDGWKTYGAIYHSTKLIRRFPLNLYDYYWFQDDALYIGQHRKTISVKFIGS